MNEKFVNITDEELRSVSGGQNVMMEGGGSSSWVLPSDPWTDSWLGTLFPLLRP